MANLFKAIKDEQVYYLIKSFTNKILNKVDKEDGKSLSTNDFTNELKSKLENIEDGANKITVDNAMSSSSTNPVQNKVVNEAISNGLAQKTQVRIMTWGADD